MEDPPIINCHTHVFTVDDVPPKLARTIAPWPLNWIIDTRWIAGLFGWFTRINDSVKTSSRYKRWARNMYAFRMALKRYLVLRVIKIVLVIWILASVFHDQYAQTIKPLLVKNKIYTPWLDKLDSWLAGSDLIIITKAGL